METNLNPFLPQDSVNRYNRIIGIFLLLVIIFEVIFYEIPSIGASVIESNIQRNIPENINISLNNVRK